MGRHSNIGPHYYRGLDSNREHHDGGLAIPSIPLRNVAEKIEEMNYGVHRFLSHLIDVRRERLAATIKMYRDKGDEDIAAYVEREGDQLATGIEQLLKEGLY
jgi:hypothetical protein